MFIVKGIVLGAVMFFAFTLVYLWAWDMIPTSNRAIGLTALRAILTHNILYWTAGVLLLALGCVIMAMWPVKVSP